MSKCERCGYDFRDDSQEYTVHANPFDCINHLKQRLADLMQSLHREWECGCGHRFVAKVILSPHATNLCGELTVYCPHCGKRPLVGGPAFSQPSRKGTNHDIAANNS